jgi:arylsulfatase A-like enzyme
VIILADDLGWRDVGHHGSEIPTPNIDRLAREGVELDRFYVQPTCSPTRAGLMTGKSPRRLGIVRPLGKNDRGGLPLEETLLPEHLRRAGYQTLMVGKWHLGNHTPDYFPQSRGFEHFYGLLSGGIGYWDHVHGGGLDWQRNGETLRETGYATRLLADESVRLLRQRDRSRPTFLYLAFNAPHLPNEAPPETIARHAAIGDSRRRVHAAMVDELDRAIGRVVDALESEGMREDTILLFASDNGGLSPGSAPAPFALVARVSGWLFDRPHPIQALEFIASNVEDGASDNRPLRGGKTRVTEGGVRVPASIGWPARLAPRRHDGFMTISDVLPTLLEAIGAAERIPDDLDGASQWAALRGAGASAIRDYLVTGFEETALYRPPWKLVTSDPPRLYDVYADPLEERDLAEREPERVAAMQAAVDAWPWRERSEASSLLELVRDPDRFGGAEDRPPWADVARDRAATRGASGSDD